ncbi:amino acid ABC transporter ATP-binding protein [Periweissella beninensis]|uniref:Amino acid ABC transporter ATP-binding protein n=1 Tax=Periweissella beninensis TaxID=504936 RepID=A0ABT0VFU8_9LACO|nr:ATP-binding cassette domain-containing protein [Periweissella beninensis]MBM7543737.1 polar amino acid transport system ATP-binding protein [Periweissella beninensis]MCM2436716.1 amino acid ABC transporter ATP-binding protein [Periweissella beninensis]MCT4395682.1 amino acid ABC transporter ATP-binding protein [Periweissella beninensis]
MITLKNIKKSFNGRIILNNLNLEIKDGEILAIVGPSGAGKTTLLRALVGLDTIDSGEILVDNQAFDPSNNANDKNMIGVVFQDYNLFPNLSVRENIGLAPRLVLKQDKQVVAQQTNELLTKLRLADKAKLYPFELSGGMKQRVAIARALAMQPKVLAYDEPTSALDPSMRNEVANLLLALKKDGVTQIIVTHDVELANKVADNIFTVTPLS